MRTASHTLFSALLTAALLLGSCGLVGNNNQEKETKADSTYLRATLNEKGSWKATETRSYFRNYKGETALEISGRFFDDDSYYNDLLVFGLYFDGIKTYLPTLNDEEISYHESDADVHIANYYPTDDTSANRLTITSYDSTTGIMKGTFRTTVVVDSADRVPEPGEPPRRRPDTLRFTDGEFRVKVEDRRDE